VSVIATSCASAPGGTARRKRVPSAARAKTSPPSGPRVFVVLRGASSAGASEGAPNASGARIARKARFAPPLLLKLPERALQLASNVALSDAAFVSPVHRPLFLLHFAESLLPCFEPFCFAATAGQPLARARVPSSPRVSSSGTAAPPGTSGLAATSNRTAPGAQGGG
jgi:hypothetical protein